jgi:N-acetyllactosaminide beta-1,3-N-acetylglucosaminyltransferase
MIIIMFIIISVLLLTMRKVGFEEPVSLKHHLIHQRQKEDCRENCSISDTVNHEEAYAKLLQGLDVFSFNWSLSRSDSKQRYRFLDFILPGNKFVELSKRYTVSIATQSSLEWLHHIVDLSQHWTGPVSLAVFVAGEEFLLTKLYIRYLRQCFPHVKEQISFHLAYSRDFPPTDDTNLAFNYKHDCSNPEAVLSDLLKYRSPGTIKWRNDVLYPQNHLRNQARRNCQTDYVYVIDVDIVPSIGMTDSLDAFLRKSQCEKLCAYVIPVYEIEENASFPRNKAEVLKMSKNKKARPFHQLVYSLAQSSTNYKR